MFWSLIKGKMLSFIYACFKLFFMKTHTLCLNCNEEFLIKDKYKPNKYCCKSCGVKHRQKRGWFAGHPELIKQGRGSVSRALNNVEKHPRRIYTFECKTLNWKGIYHGALEKKLYAQYNENKLKA